MGLGVSVRATVDGVTVFQHSHGSIGSATNIFTATIPTCQDFACTSQSQTPDVESSANYPNGYGGIDACEESINNPVGIFRPLLDDSDLSFEPYMVDVCYNSTTGKWQNKISNNQLSVRAILDICLSEDANNVFIDDVNEISQIPINNLCEALRGFKGHKNYPINFTYGDRKFWIMEVLWQHEELHNNDFQNITLSAAAKKPIKIDGKKFNSFDDAFNFSENSCENGNYNEAKSEANDQVKKVLDKLRIEIVKRWNEDRNATSELNVHKSITIKNVVQKYTNALRQRMNSLNINCG